MIEIRAPTPSVFEEYLTSELGFVAKENQLFGGEETDFDDITINHVWPDMYLFASINDDQMIALSRKIDNDDKSDKVVCIRRKGDLFTFKIVS